MQQVKELVDNVLTKLETLARTRTVVGDPMEMKGKVLVPLVELSIGVGGGGGEGTGEGGGRDEKGREGKGHGEGRGAGVGGGLRIAPVSIICVDDSGVSVYAVSRRSALEKITELMPQVMEKIAEKKAHPGGREEEQ